MHRTKIGQLKFLELAQFKVKFRFILFFLVVAENGYRCKCNFNSADLMVMI